DLPAFGDYGMDGRTYRYFEGTPLFAFGHGLSYTRFAYHDLVFDPATGTAIVVVANTGTRDGDEVVQLYVRDSRPGRPRLQLCGFQRVTIAAGESREVVVPVDTRTLRRWEDRRGDYLIDRVPRELLAGPSSDRLPLCRALPANAFSSEICR
nr:fibronectin type III-like domain-contianing protein [Opitutaceae bacterium]